MTDCPPGLRGDLSKWLCEINSGVYIGQVSKRVRVSALGAHLPKFEKWPGDNGIFNKRGTKNGIPCT